MSHRTQNLKTSLLSLLMLFSAHASFANSRIIGGSGALHLLGQQPSSITDLMEVKPSNPYAFKGPRYAWIFDSQGYLATQPGQNGALPWNWTTNGVVFNCVETSRSGDSITVYCPTIKYSFFIHDTYLTIESPGSNVNYSGHWDDRKEWFSSKLNNLNYRLGDNGNWTENFYVDGKTLYSLNLRELSRDDHFIYLQDDARNLKVALSKNGRWLSKNGGAWEKQADQDPHWAFL